MENKLSAFSINFPYINSLLRINVLFSLFKIMKLMELMKQTTLKSVYSTFSFPLLDQTYMTGKCQQHYILEFETKQIFLRIRFTKTSSCLATHVVLQK
jgi:hypothetical protein